MKLTSKKVISAAVVGVMLVGTAQIAAANTWINVQYRGCHRIVIKHIHKRGHRASWRYAANHGLSYRPWIQARNTVVRHRQYIC